jgi:two-component system, NtrC family, response regulator HydG
VGDHRPIQVDARIITATNRDLPNLIEQGRFREDFFYRINVIPIHVPPLRERKEDIPLLARSFFNRVKLKSGKPIEGISREALNALIHHDWPGNVRELRSAFEFAFVSCREAMISPYHLPVQILRKQDNHAAAVTAPALRSSLGEIKKQRLVEALRIAGGNRTEAARILGISRTSVWQQMKYFEILSEPYK